MEETGIWTVCAQVEIGPYGDRERFTETFTVDGPYRAEGEDWNELTSLFRKQAMRQPMLELLRSAGPVSFEVLSATCAPCDSEE